jgi:type IV pilus assembly protein PilC
MKAFKYDGIDKAGRKRSGSINAKDLRDARKLLRLQGVRAKKVTPPSLLEFDLSEWFVDNGFVPPFGRKELMIFTKQLSVMVSAGVPIIQAFEILFKSEKNKSLKKAIKTISENVKEGKSFSEALSKQKGFGKLYCNLVKAGETGGVLDRILIKLVEHMEKQEKIKKQVKSAMTYPTLVVVIGIGVVWGMMVFVVPQFVDMLEGVGKKPPFVTQLVMDISTYLQKYGLMILPILVGSVILYKFINGIPSGKKFFDLILMKAPIFGDIIIKGNLATFSRTFSTMLSSGVSLIESLEICIDIIDQSIMVKDLENVKREIESGKSMEEPLSKIEYFPELVTSMVKIGEQTGQLDEMFVNIANIFDEEVESSVAHMTTLIEPVVIVVLGSIVGFILIAMYLPIFMAAG